MPTALVGLVGFNFEALPLHSAPPELNVATPNALHTSRNFVSIEFLYNRLGRSPIVRQVLSTDSQPKHALGRMNGEATPDAVQDVDRFLDPAVWEPASELTMHWVCSASRCSSPSVMETLSGCGGTQAAPRRLKSREVAGR